MFYSAKMNAWFDGGARADYEKKGTWPDDAKQYPRVVFNEVVAYRPAGKIMQPDANGDPVLVDPAPPTLEDLAVQVRAERDRLLSVNVDPIVSNPLRWSDLTAEQQQALIDYRRALLEITDQAGFPEAIDWPAKPQ